MDRSEPEDARIIAHINSKWIITVHKMGCPELDFVNKERLMNAFYEWDENASLFLEIEFEFYNKIWVLKELSAILFSMNINVLGLTTEQQDKSKMILKFSLEIQEYDYLQIDRFIDRVKFNLEQTYCSHKIIQVVSE
jgi:(p)ppGpp synthase/HD superfamily hydrolase